MSGKNRAVLILAGGAGTRLWPLSTDENPKQFLQIFDGQSLLQKSWARLRRLVGAEALYLSTNDRYLDKSLEQLPELRRENVLLEPLRRNTAPAIATCCAEIARRQPGITIGIFPSDQAITDEAAFAQVADRAFEFASRGEYLVTLGIRPTGPNTGFGYLEMGAELAPGVVRVGRFLEKPDEEKARALFDSGRFAWNAGIFVWRSDAFQAALAANAPEIARIASLLASPEGFEKREELYAAMPSISIDYAVMEKAANVASVWGDFGWSDVGSWGAVSRITSDGRGPAVFEEAAAGNYIIGGNGKPVAVVGLEEIAVIDSPGGLLVLSLEKSELLAQVVKRIPSDMKS